MTLLMMIIVLEKILQPRKRRKMCRNTLSY